MKASNWTPASLAGDVQRIHRPSTVCFHPASLRGCVAALTIFSSTGAPMAVSQPSPSARWFSSSGSTGAGVAPVAVRTHMRSETGVS